MDCWALEVVVPENSRHEKFHAKRSKATNVISDCGGIEDMRKKLPWLS